MIGREELEKALAGLDPPLGRALSLAELGRALAPHRRGAYAGQPYRKQTIALYLHEPEKQGADFTEAFLSWRAATRQRLEGVRLRFPELPDLLLEAGYIQQVGPDPVKALLLVGDLGERYLVRVNGAAMPVLCLAEPRQCGCGRWFVPRSWNQKRCERSCSAGKISVLGR